MTTETDRDQYDKIHSLAERLHEHEKGCERRYGETMAQFATINTRLDSLEKTLNKTETLMRNIFVSLLSGGGVAVAAGVFAAVWQLMGAE